MSIFQSLIKKEVLHLLRDFRTVTVVLVMPVILLLLFGFAISTEVNDVRVVAVVEQHTDETKQIIDRFRTNSYFTFAGIVTYNEVESLLRKGRADAAVVFRTEDGKLKHQIVVDASNTNMAQTSTAYLESVIRSGASIPVVTDTLYNPQLRSAYNFVPGIMGMIFIMICAMMTCQRKGNGDHELVAGVAGTSSDDYPGQAGALLPVVVHHIDIDAVVELYRVGHTFLFQCHPCDMGNYPVCGSCPCIGIAYFHHRFHTGICLTCFRSNVHDSCCFVVRHDFPGRKYAVGLAMVLVYHPGTLVYFGYACADDSAASHRICADRGSGFVGNGVGRAGLGRQEV